MSPTPYVARTPRLGFPRVSGDEPLTGRQKVYAMVR